jgi:hypothetical protein
MFRDCSICSAPVQVLNAVNDALAKHEKLRDIAARSGFSKSAIGRHKLKCCPREILTSYKSARFDHQHGRIFVQMPNDAHLPSETRGKIIPEHQKMTAADSLLLLIYVSPLFDDQGRYSNADQAHVRAIEENFKRDVALPLDQCPTAE